MLIEEVVECYNHNTKRNSGEYTIKQCVINLKEGHGFEPGQKVLIFKIDEFDDLLIEHESEILNLRKDFKKEIEDLQETHRKEIEDLQKNFDQVKRDLQEEIKK